MKTTITFLGTASVVPEAGNDTASFLLNGTHLIDAGWYSALNMLRYGFNPMDLDCVFLTHCHHGHYLGLAGILFYLRMRQSERPDRPPLHVIGPEADIHRTLDRAHAYLQTDRFPDVGLDPVVTRVRPGDSLEREHFEVATVAGVHSVQAIAYRFTDKATRASIAISGDTARNPAIADLAHGCDLLIHEASSGAIPMDLAVHSGHSSAMDAARVAALASVKRLALVHCAEPLRPDALAAAQAIFANTFLPEPGETVEVAPVRTLPGDRQKLTSN